jgi:hypothetical protein
VDAVLTDTASVAVFDAESAIVSEHDPAATGETVTPFSVPLIAAVAVPPHPDTEYGGVPPETVALCAGAPGVVKLSAFGDTVMAAAAPFTVTASGTVNPVLSAIP